MGSQNDDYYCAGSDDFRGYVWKMPGAAELAELRREVSVDDWLTQDYPDVIGATHSFWTLSGELSL
jgi:WD repeat-containing protein 22